ncbi:MAG: GNAT family N-acetyltransferase [Flavobacteriales bacterium]|nr:GNAT family N-acetyltransferase [Flavobacteriales bacterium]
MRSFDQLTVRPVAADDAEAFFRLIDRDRALFATYFPVTTGRTSDPHATLGYMRDLVAQAVAQETFCYLVLQEGASEPVGALFLRSFDRRVAKCEAAYLVSSAHQGKGIASGAVAWAIDEAFRTHGMNKVFLRVDPDNAASIRVAEKNGFLREGLLRQDFRTNDDRLMDVIVFGKLR